MSDPAKLAVTTWAVFMLAVCTGSFVFMTRAMWRDAYEAIDDGDVSGPIGRVMAVVLALCSVTIHGMGYLGLVGILVAVW